MHHLQSLQAVFKVIGSGYGRFGKQGSQRLGRSEKPLDFPHGFTDHSIDHFRHFSDDHVSTLYIEEQGNRNAGQQYKGEKKTGDMNSQGIAFTEKSAHDAPVDEVIQGRD